MTTLSKQHISTKTNPSILFLFLLLILLLLIPSPTSSQNCQRFCGQIPLKYPFGSGPGCGDPRFLSYLTCDNDNQRLSFNTRRGSYTVTSIDYSNRVIFVSDSSMSTCSCSQPSHGFSLDWDAPFSFRHDTLFALLGCSPESSPIFHPREPESLNSNNNKSSSFSRAPLCDERGLPICGFLYSCRAISAMISAPVSTCCVYTPVDLGPAFDMDLEELKCRSYSGFYGFDGSQSDPDSWKYGVALEYKFSVYDEFPSYCADCEKSFGVCGYTGAYNSFICNCPSGLNTSSDCLFGYSSHGSTLVPWRSTGLVIMLVCYWSFLVLFSFF